MRRFERRIVVLLVASLCILGACRRRGGSGAGAPAAVVASAPRTLADALPDSVFVGYLDAARARSTPLYALARAAIAMSPDVARSISDAQRTCGFDPIERIGSMTASFTGTAPLGNSPAVLVRGTGRTPDIMRCILGIAAAQHQPLAQVRTTGVHPVLDAPPTPGATPSPSDMQAVVFDNALLLVPPANVDAMAQLFDRRGFGATSPSLVGVAGAAGGDPMVYLAGDIARIRLAMRPSDQPTFTEAVFNIDPQTQQRLWLSLVSGAFAIVPTQTGLRFVVHSVFASPADAHVAAESIRQVLNNATAMIGLGLGALSLGASPGNPGSAQLTQIVNTLVPMISRARVTEVGPASHFEIEPTYLEITSLMQAGQALMSGLMTGGGATGVPGVPGLPAATP